MRLTPRTLRHPIRSMFRRAITGAVAVALWENRERIIGRSKGVLAGRRHVTDMTRPAGDPWVPADRRPPTLFEARQADVGAAASPDLGKQFDSISANGVRDISDLNITDKAAGS